MRAMMRKRLHVLAKWGAQAGAGRADGTVADGPGMNEGCREGRKAECAPADHPSPLHKLRLTWGDCVRS